MVAPISDQWNDIQHMLLNEMFGTQHIVGILLISHFSLFTSRVLDFRFRVLGVGCGMGKSRGISNIHHHDECQSETLECDF
jgi:hypothetical protein